MNKMAQHGKYNIRLPRFGALIKVIPRGFDQPYTGRLIAIKSGGSLVLDIDEQEWLPKDMRFREVSQLEEYEVI